MKCLSQIALSALMLLFTNAYAQEDFKSLRTASDTLYGYSAEKPLQVKVGSKSESIEYVEIFMEYLSTADDQALELVKQYSIQNPSYDPAFIVVNGLTGEPFNGNRGKLEVYQFITSYSGEYIYLYVDVFGKDELMIPKGLKIKSSYWK